MKEKIEKIKNEALADISSVQDDKQLRDLEVKYLGRKGELTVLLKGVKDLSAEEKPVIGKLANSVKGELEKKIEQKRLELEKEGIDKQLKGDFFDVTLPGRARKMGHIHPLSQVYFKLPVC